MYYPYLRGKQFELKALKEFSEANPNAKDIIPIIEPVSQSYRALTSAMDELVDNGMKFAMIVNPRDGDFRHSTVSFSLLDEKPELLSITDKWIPAYICEGDLSLVNGAINTSPFNEVMLVFKSCANIDDPLVQTLINNPKVSLIVNCFGKSVSRRTKKYLIDSGKRIICLEDSFITRSKNADYKDYEDEFFSEMPFFWQDENYSGFSDYTAMSSDYTEGGYQPYAIAIHMTYLRGEEIYIHHFVSDSNLTTSDIKGKFVEAARKVEPFFAGNVQSAAVEDLINRANQGERGFPGLGYLKKLSVLNHLEVIKSVIS